MDEQVQAFIDKWGEKTAAKQVALAAMQEVALAEKEGRDTTSHQAEADRYGHAVGDEGRCEAEAIAIAKAYIRQHRAELAFLDQQGQEGLVNLVSSFRQAGELEQSKVVEMFLMAKFAPVQVGQGFPPDFSALRDDWEK